MKRDGIHIPAPTMEKHNRSQSFHARRRRSSKLAAADALQSHAMPSISLRLKRSLDSLRSSSREAVESSSASTTSSKSSLSAKTSRSIKDAGRKWMSLPKKLRRRTSATLEKFRNNNPTQLSFIIEEDKDPLPEIDHDVDLNVVLTAFTIQEDLDAALEHVLMPAIERNDQNYPTRKCDEAGPPFLWFKLPVNCRRKIYKLLFPETDKKVSLSAEQFTKAVFPSFCFLSPWDVLHDVWGVLESCSAWRKETLAYFWSQYHFHITLNEFTMKFTSPLSHGWVYPYLDFIQRLTIERDFTRLAGSHEKGAAGLSFAISKKVEIMLDVLVAGLLRRNGMPMAELHLMARKYRGLRPADHRPDSLDPVFYVPPWVEENCAGVRKLEPILNRFRMSGFTKEFTKETMQFTFKNRRFYKHYELPDESPWPSLTPHPVVNFFLLAALKQAVIEPSLQRARERAEEINDKTEERATELEPTSEPKQPSHQCSTAPAFDSNIISKLDSDEPEQKQPSQQETPVAISVTQLRAPESKKSGQKEIMTSVSTVELSGPNATESLQKETVLSPSNVEVASKDSGRESHHDEVASSASDPTAPALDSVQEATQNTNPITPFNPRPVAPTSSLKANRDVAFISDDGQEITRTPDAVRHPSPQPARSFDASFISDDMTYVAADDETPANSSEYNSSKAANEVTQAQSSVPVEHDTTRVVLSITVAQNLDVSDAHNVYPVTHVPGSGQHGSKISDAGKVILEPQAVPSEVNSDRNSLKLLMDFHRSSDEPNVSRTTSSAPIGGNSANDILKSSGALNDRPTKPLPSIPKSTDKPDSNFTPTRTPKVSALIGKFSTGNTLDSNNSKLHTPKVATPKENTPPSRIPIPNRVRVPSATIGSSYGEHLLKPMLKLSKSIETPNKNYTKPGGPTSDGASSGSKTPEPSKDSKPLPKFSRSSEEQGGTHTLIQTPRNGSLVRAASKTPDIAKSSSLLTPLSGASKLLPKPSKSIERLASSQTTSQTPRSDSPASGSKISRIPLPVATSATSVKPLPKNPAAKVKSPNSSDEFRERFPEFSPTFLASKKPVTETDRSVSPIFEKEKYEAMIAKMAQMNENDEAFQRTMGALQALGDQEKDSDPRGRSTPSRSTSSTVPSRAANQPRNGNDDRGSKPGGRPFFPSFSFRRS